MPTFGPVAGDSVLASLSAVRPSRLGRNGFWEVEISSRSYFSVLCPSNPERQDVKFSFVSSQAGCLHQR